MKLRRAHKAPMEKLGSFLRIVKLGAIATTDCQNCGTGQNAECHHATTSFGVVMKLGGGIKLDH